MAGQLAPAPSAPPATNVGGQAAANASVFPPDITGDAGFNSTYADLNAVR